MDLLLKGLIKSFVQSEELGKISESDQFEIFASWLVLPAAIAGRVPAPDLLLDPGTPGIDSIVMDINGEVVWDPSDIDSACQGGGQIDIGFTFVQAKLSSKIDGAQVLNFGNEVLAFLNVASAGYHKRDNLAAALSHLYDQYSAQIRSKPSVRLFFVTGAPRRSIEQQSIRSKLERIRTDLESVSHVGAVEVSALGTSDLHELWSRRNNGNTGSLVLTKPINLPEMPGVDQAILGLASVRDLLGLLESDEGQLDETLFYDNVRGFQGAQNPVNRQIIETLASDERALLPVMNNGVTIVAADYLQRPGDTIGLSGYQVVNGCQTSHCLYAAKDAIGSAAADTFIPVRVVVTKDSDVATRIIMATNSQTPVRDNELESLTQFQKKLEQFYRTDPLEIGLHYERRPGQFYGEDVVWTRVVSIRDQMRFVGAMFLNLPHESAGYVGQLRDRIGGQLFADAHALEPYAASAFAAYKLENAFRYDFDTRYKPIRYHILMVYKFLQLSGDSAALDSKAAVTQSERIVSGLKASDPTKKFREAAEFVVRSFGSVPSPEMAKRQSFTQDLIRELHSSRP